MQYDYFKIEDGLPMKLLNRSAIVHPYNVKIHKKPNDGLLTVYEGLYYCNEIQEISMWGKHNPRAYGAVS